MTGTATTNKLISSDVLRKASTARSGAIRRNRRNPLQVQQAGKPRN
jgi:hypothetical protein